MGFRMAKVNTDPKKIDDVLSRGPVDVIEKEEIKRKMLSGKPLNIYYGIDPTGKDMHLGHASTQMKVRDFQELGHNITLLVGDYTVRVGDHSIEEKQRSTITDEQIAQNMKTFKEQFAKTVDIDKVEIRYNSEWLSKLKFIDIIELAQIFTVQQMIERDAFQKRLKKNNPIGFDELMYPLMQGYDAYALKTDIQIEGTDQLFNMIAGRKIMEHFGMDPQGIITMPMLIGPDGQEMHKSLGNYIAVSEEPKEMYGKLMSIKDEVMKDYFLLLTRLPMNEVGPMIKASPMEAKKKLAYEITKFFNDEKSATDAQEHFGKTVQKGEVPEEAKTMDFAGEHTALDIGVKLVEEGVIESNAQAKRLIAQGGLRINDEQIKDSAVKTTLESGDTIRVGKRRFVKIK